MRIGFVRACRCGSRGARPRATLACIRLDGTEIALRAETARHNPWFSEILVSKRCLVQEDLVQRDLGADDDVVQRGGLREARRLAVSGDPVERMLRYSFGPLLAIGEKDPTARVVKSDGGPDRPRRIQGSRRSQPLTRFARRSVKYHQAVTVEHASWGCWRRRGTTLRIVDLPGVYSLTPIRRRTRGGGRADRQDGRDATPGCGFAGAGCHPSLRHLVLAAPVIALGLPRWCCWNMADVFAKGGGSLDVLKLAKELGAPVAMVSATQETGLDAVNRFLRQEHSHGLPALLPFSRTCRSRASGQPGGTANRLPQHLPSAWSRRLDDVFLHKIWGRLFSCWWWARSSKPCLESANP